MCKLCDEIAKRKNPNNWFGWNAMRHVRFYGYRWFLFERNQSKYKNNCLKLGRKGSECVSRQRFRAYS